MIGCMIEDHQDACCSLKAAALAWKSTQKAMQGFPKVYNDSEALSVAVFRCCTTLASRASSFAYTAFCLLKGGRVGYSGLERLGVKYTQLGGGLVSFSPHCSSLPILRNLIQ